MCSTDKALSQYHDPANGLWALCAVSTYALEDLSKEPEPPKFDAVFLDYCGTPDLSMHDWHADVRTALKMRAHASTPIYLTFTQRKMPHSVSFVHHSVRAAFPDLVVSSVSQYMDTSAMAIYTILPKTEAFTFSPLSSYLKPMIGDVVQITSLGGWTGTVTRDVSSTFIEVQETGTPNVYSVPLANVKLFDPVNGRVVPRAAAKPVAAITGRKAAPSGKKKKKKRPDAVASASSIAPVLYASPTSKKPRMVDPPAAAVHPFVPVAPIQVAQPVYSYQPSALDPTALLQAAQMAAQAVLAATKVAGQMIGAQPRQLTASAK